MTRRSLTPAQHLKLGALLKRIRRDLHDAAVMCRVYGKLSQQLFDTANSLPRDWLEARLIEDVGASVLVEGVPCREVYFGKMEEIDG
jgi:hypothetical protein